MNVSTFDTLPLEETLEDLSARFIVNLPAEELESLDRVCFQIEQAHWYYEDFVRPQAAKPSLLPSFSLKQFSLLIFKTCPLLQHLVPQHAEIWTSFMAYKERVPVCGAILISKEWDKVLLVKGWNKGASWSFPRGKINKGETEAACAVREVLEETGFDLTDRFDDDQLEPGYEEPEGSAKDPYYVEVVIKEQKIRLYFIPEVAENTFFETRTRKEISKIDWFRLGDLPTWSKERKKKGDTPVPQQQQPQQPVKSAKFYMVTPFISHLKLWIERNKPKKKRKQHQQQQQSAEQEELIPALQPATMTNEESTAALKAFFFGAAPSTPTPTLLPSDETEIEKRERHSGVVQPRPRASPQQTSNLLALLRSSPSKTQRDWTSTPSVAATAEEDSDEQRKKRQALLNALFAQTSRTPPPTNDTPQMAPQTLPGSALTSTPSAPNERLLMLLQGNSPNVTARNALPPIPPPPAQQQQHPHPPAPMMFSPPPAQPFSLPQPFSPPMPLPMSMPPASMSRPLPHPQMHMPGPPHMMMMMMPPPMMPQPMMFPPHPPLPQPQHQHQPPLPPVQTGAQSTTDQRTQLLGMLRGNV